MRRFYEINAKNSELPPNADPNSLLRGACIFFEANSNVRLNFQALPQAINDRPLCLDKIRADILRKGPKIFSALAYRDPQAALLERSGCEF